MFCPTMTFWPTWKRYSYVPLWVSGHLDLTMDFPTCHYSWLFRKNLLERHLNVSFQFITIKIEVSNHDDGCVWRNGTDFKNASGEPKCCPIFENDVFLLSVMKMWVTKCIFLCSSTFYHVKLEKSQMSCLDMRFTKLSTKGV